VVLREVTVEYHAVLSLTELMMARLRQLNRQCSPLAHETLGHLCVLLQMQCQCHNHPHSLFRPRYDQVSSMAPPLDERAALV
jgi:hypothetical protein